MSYADTHEGWFVATADPGTRLREHPALLRGPDVGVIRTERRPVGKGVDGWLNGAPDLAVEVMGDDATTSELMRKALEYVAAGGRLVWIVDPDAEQVIVVTPPNAFLVLGRDDTLDGGDVLPDFACSVAALFE
jgi:Uma2 family endonuclease